MIQDYSNANIVILTGAGLSAPSGIETFRSQDGLWEQHLIEDVATPEGYASNPELVDTFYNQRRAQLNDPLVSPNAAHVALAKLELAHQGRLFVITQNVDDLHERAGSKQVLHMHGEIRKGRCPRSNLSFLMKKDFSSEQLCSCCQPAQRLRPHIVWFGEMPIGMGMIERALTECDLFISVGTSGVVYPAAGFVRLAKAFGAKTIDVNTEPCYTGSFDAQYKGCATETLPKLIDKILNGQPLSHKEVELV
ncbi:NAD-dependent deacylase [Parashewanella spongiae]|uniref:NAD-dependent protein deacylase n=1 Tax=Parashewanella spongiae TaxID=342950 RepID=A0A3A6TY79_9GAMM|nr:NAD-dependent deacylase [Parashewanella spongiae]MCL1076726.1 NAD-dependent deacylase [Parashewanella spongiae]RJY19469.1 NAD-dependent deacylase [Parashewanella spongiae]